MAVRILAGDALSMLRTLPDASVQCVVTSPPYFALRSYGTEPKAWGGDPDHEHEWGPAGLVRVGNNSGVRGKSETETLMEFEGRALLEDRQRMEPAGAVCSCGAWRGELGLEPTPALFISHLMAVFDEVRRVLRPDGTCWVNLGSSYFGSGKGPTGKNGLGDQAKRQGFVGAAATSDQSQSRERGRAPACDTDGRARSDSHPPDSAYSGLCDGCLADFLSHRDRTAGTHPQQRFAGLPPSMTGRDSEPLDSLPEIPSASAHDVQASTTLEFWRLSRGACSRCASRAASCAQLGLPQGEPVVLGSAHMTDAPSAARSTSDATRGQRERTGDTGETDGASVDRTGDRGADSSSYLDFSIADRHLKPKDLILIPEMFALAMQSRGWWVRSRICWAKTSAMPESVTDRPTNAWEHIWMFSKQARYFYDQTAVRQPNTSAEQLAHNQRYARPYEAWDSTADQRMPGVLNNAGIHSRGGNVGANLRNFWLLGPEPSREQHYAAFPTEIPKRCILAGTSERGQCPACGAPWVRVVSKPSGGLSGRSWHDHSADRERGNDKDGGEVVWKTYAPGQTTGWSPPCQCDAGPPVPQTVLDPFLGSGTTALVADRLGRDAIGVELSQKYVEIARRRIESDEQLFSAPVVVETDGEQLDLFAGAV